MYNKDTDLLFPLRVIPALREVRGPVWRRLVDHLLTQAEDSLEKAAFVLLMARLGNCNTCEAGSFRALQGCTACARQTIRRFRGSDSELEERFHNATIEVQRYIETINGKV
jgi:hypothetical protein